jgi:hypothetical protein
MHRFESATVLTADQIDVFHFHENPENIRKISPPFLRIPELHANPVAREGEKFTLHLRVFGVPILWRGEWAQVVSPALLLDTASIFPFRTWRHEHRFVSRGAETEMIDVVIYQLPWGIFGRLLGATVFRMLLVAMFVGRHQATRTYFKNRPVNGA